MEGIAERQDLDVGGKVDVNLFWSTEYETWIAELPEYDINTFGFSPSDALQELGTVLEIYMDLDVPHPIQDILSGHESEGG